MTIRQVVPDIKSKRPEESRAFYVDFLGMKVGMDLGRIVSFVSPSNPTAQVSVMRDEDTSALLPEISIEVEDVDAVHARAVERRLEIVYPLTTEPLGSSALFCARSERIVVNVMSHLPS